MVNVVDRTPRTYLAVALARQGHRQAALAAWPEPAPPGAWHRLQRAELRRLLRDAQRAEQALEALPPPQGTGLAAARGRRVLALVRAMRDPAGALPDLQAAAVALRAVLPPTAPELADLEAVLAQAA